MQGSWRRRSLPPNASAADRTPEIIDGVDAEAVDGMDRLRPHRERSVIEGLGRYCLAVERAVERGREIPAEGARHGAAAHGIEPLARYEGREGAPHTAEEG